MVNFFDLVVVIITLGFAVKGFFEGLVRGAVKLVGFIIINIFMAGFSDTIVSLALEIGIFPPKISIPSAFLLILIGGTAAFYVVAHLLHRLVHMTPAGFIDSGLGCVFGTVKALILCGILATGISFAPSDSFLRNQYDKSLTAVTLVTFLSESIPLIKKAVVPLYQRFKPVLSEPENKKDSETISPEFI